MAQLHTQLKSFLLFCLERGLVVNKQSLLIFNQQRTVRQVMHFSRFLTLYEQMGRPFLLSTTQLGEMPKIGAYLISELIQYWYWPPWRTKPEEIGQGRGLLTWWTYQWQVDNGALSIIESIDGYLKCEYNRGVSTELIKQRLVVIRRWARWVLKQATVLRLDYPAQQQLQLIDKLSIGKSPWMIERPPQWDHENPVAKVLHLRKVVPLLDSLLRRGIPLNTIRQIRVCHVHSRYFEPSTIDLDNGLSWALTNDDFRRLSVYLEVTNRLQWPTFTLDEYLFAEADWDTLWELSRQHLRLYREGRQRAKAHRLALSHSTWPVYFRQNGSKPLFSTGTNE